MKIKTDINQKLTLLDGAMGTVLQAAGLKLGELPEVFNLLHPEQIADIHRQYMEQGSRIIYANTFGANPLKTGENGYDFRELIRAGIACAQAARRAFCADRTGRLCSNSNPSPYSTPDSDLGSNWTLNADLNSDLDSNSEPGAGERPQIALDIGPLGVLLEPSGSLPFETACRYFADMIQAGASAGADLIVIETMTDLYEAKAAILAARETAPDLPVLFTMSYEANGRTFTGCCPAAQAALAESLGVTAVGINCSLGPAEILPLIREMSRYTGLPLIIKANAGLPDPATGIYSIPADEFAAVTRQLVETGVRYIGGCCGTTPTYIRALRTETAALLDAETGCVQADLIARRPQPRPVLCCTPVAAVEADRFTVVGERLNPTGKPRLRQALRDLDIGYLQRIALEEQDAGADVLDVNVGAPDVDEADCMQRVIPAIQSVTHLPLQLDSSEPAALAAGLRVYNGKPVVNSVNGKAEQLAQVLPLVKRYGAALVCLPLDENGIPETVAERMTVIRRIIAACDDAGIPRHDLIIDCLALTVSAQPAGAQVTLETIRQVTAEFGVRTLLGISNVSFGLPARGLVNRTFLSMAVGSGLSMGILNPNDREMMDAVAALHLLAQNDANSVRFIGRFADRPAAPAVPPGVAGDAVRGRGDAALSPGAADGISAGDAAVKTGTGADVRAETDAKAETEALKQAVCRGLSEDAGRLTDQLLETRAALDIVDGVLIPALDVVGDQYERGRIFLPQLVGAANAAQQAFEAIRKRLARDMQGEPVYKGKVLLATVEGDVHDIGKNIVKVVLENYGYKVLDLGKNVPPAAVVEAAVREDIHLIGLSALMTTTLKSMARTIRALRDSGHPCRIMAGGAVLTPDYAHAIGADFYVRDAKASVDAAKTFFGGSDAACVACGV